MDINITAIERSLRLYAAPVSIFVIGIIGALLINPDTEQSGPIAGMLVPMLRYAAIGFALLSLLGVLWGGYRVWLEWRWMSGKSTGSCHNCGGDMRHLEGRYGNYSKCLMCGAKREGHR